MAGEMHNQEITHWLYSKQPPVIGDFLPVWHNFDTNVCMSLKCVCSCAAAYVLLAEEEATTITEAERLFRKALSIGKCV